MAPDSYKGSLSSIQAAAAMERGIQDVFPSAEIIKVPVADGGEGTVEALLAATGGRLMKTEVMGPLGDKVEAHWSILGDGKTAVIEMAAASGLPLVPKDRRNPLLATTYGTGQLIQAALDAGIRSLILGIGGSATNDGGAGMARALGVKFLDQLNRELPNGGAALKHLRRIDISGLDLRLASTKILVACDVDNPLCGPCGASAVYGPQKGATLEMVTELDQALNHYAQLAKSATGREVAEIPGAGAAGGLGAGLLFFTPAELRPGIQIILEAAGFEEKIKEADLIITGEGRTDRQTAHGKAPAGVAALAQKYKVPVVCLSGGLGPGHEDVLQKGISGLMSIVPEPMSLEACLGNANRLVSEAAARLCRLIRVGMNMSKR